MTIDTKRLATDAAYWDSVATEGAKYYCTEAGVFHAHQTARSCCIPRPTAPAAPEWDGEGLPPESIAEFRKALAINLQNSIEAITGESFSDDDSLILAHEMMVKYDLSEKLKFSGDQRIIDIAPRVAPERWNTDQLAHYFQSVATRR